MFRARRFKHKKNKRYKMPENTRNKHTKKHEEIDCIQYKSPFHNNISAKLYYYKIRSQYIWQKFYCDRTKKPTQNGLHCAIKLHKKLR